MSEVVTVARQWLGTKFHWGASLKGVGCDCRGLISGVARDLGRPEASAWEATWNGYGRSAPSDQLAAGMAHLFDPATEKQPGDVLLLNITGKPRHLAIYAGEGRMIHTYSNGPGIVVEGPMGRVWTNAVHSIWRWRWA